MAERFGPALWSVRVLTLLTPDGPEVHRAVAKIATGSNPADNFWRAGNLVGAIDRASGRIVCVVGGTGAAMGVNPVHPDNGRPLQDTLIPDWSSVQALAMAAAQVVPGTRTQSADIALTDRGPVLLEVNFGGDLNLARPRCRRADEAYARHLRHCGYRV